MSFRRWVGIICSSLPKNLGDALHNCRGHIVMNSNSEPTSWGPGIDTPYPLYNIKTKMGWIANIRGA
jgi:hypothetical protein